MKQITSIKELKKLKKDELFYVVEKGKDLGYRFVTIHPTWDDAVVAINDDNHSKATIFYDGWFGRESVFLKGKYNSNQMGGIMISQLEKTIKDIKIIYTNPL